MQIEWVKLKGFRNFRSTHVNMAEKTLIIGANDVGKTNLLYAIRLLLDRTLSAADIEPDESDFHVTLDGKQATELSITAKLAGITEDAVLSSLKGAVSEKGCTYVRYSAQLSDLEHRLSFGHALKDLEEVEARFYLKYIHFRYIQSSRNLLHFINTEKRHLLRLAKEAREESQKTTDQTAEGKIQSDLADVNEAVGKLSYVADSTAAVNTELGKLSHHHADYKISLEAKAIRFATFLDQLSLGATTQSRSVGLGGDGRNNQILVALWKAKSEREHDCDSEAVIYCIEEPEAHLHPHQQRKLAQYLIDELPGQILISTHSPQITEQFRPDGIVRLLEKAGKTAAASKGCSECIDKAWEDMGYRMSIIPAEAFFADAVFLVEGPSEALFYNELALQLSIDLDYHNVSILAVDGIDFKVFVRILDALEIPWVMRTDNDVFKVPKKDEWRFAGLNRALDIADENTYKNVTTEWSPERVHEWWIKQKDCLTLKGIYLSKCDLEHDVGEACAEELKAYAEEEELDAAVKHLQGKKALRMGEFLAQHGEALNGLCDDPLAKPLKHLVASATPRKRKKVKSDLCLD